VNKLVAFVVFCFLSGCSLRDESWIKYRDADPELVFRSKATVPPIQEEMKFVVTRHLFGKYDEKPRLHTNIESLCYVDASTLQVVQLDNRSKFQWNLKPLDLGITTIYYNLDTRQAWMISRAMYDRPIDRTHFENVYGAIIHLPKDSRLGMCK